MPALPIAERELRVAARNRETYWSRSGVVLGLGLLWIPGWMGTFGTTTEMNTFVFNGMLWAAFAVSCLACLFTADAISRERREGTLGLLFLSRVKVWDVLFGKLGSSGFKSLCMLAAFLPMLMIPVLAGGVTGGEAFREGLVLLDTFWFSLCVGLWASTRSSEAFKTIKTACLVVFFIALNPVIFLTAPAFWNRVLFPPYDYLVLLLESLSPLGALQNARDSSYHNSALSFWISLAVVQVFGWAMLLLTVVRLRRSIREPDVNLRTGASAAHITVVQSKESPSSPNPRFKKRVRFLHAYKNPIDWLVQRQHGIRATLWLAATIEILYFVSSWAIFRGILNLNWPAVVGWVVWFAASTSTDALFARAGSMFFYESKRSGQLEMLLTTPLGPQGVLEGQWSALKKLLAWPVAIALGAMLLDEDLLLITQVGQPGAFNFGWTAQCFITWGIDITSSILGILAVCWFGMLFALKGKTTVGIILRSAGLGTGLPALFKTLFALGAERITFTVSSSGLWQGTIANWIEELIIALYYLWLFRYARRRVIEALSGMAKESSSPRKTTRTETRDSALVLATD